LSDPGFIYILWALKTVPARFVNRSNHAMSKPTVSAVAVEDLLKPVLLKDLRLACRARGLNPGGSRDTLFERVKEHMLQTGNL